MTVTASTSDYTLLMTYLQLTQPQLNKLSKQTIVNDLLANGHSIYDLLTNDNLTKSLIPNQKQTELWRIIQQLYFRGNKQQLKNLTTFDHLTDIESYLTHYFAGTSSESVLLIGINNRREVIDTYEVNTGDILTTSIDNAKIVKWCLNNHATGLIVAHNHPGGTSEPSDEDLNESNQLKTILKIVNVLLIDSIIVNKDTITWLSKWNSTVS